MNPAKTSDHKQQNAPAYWATALVRLVSNLFNINTWCGLSWQPMAETKVYRGTDTLNHIVWGIEQYCILQIFKDSIL